MEDTGKLILEYLKDYHKSEDTALRAVEVRELFTLKDRQVRNIVSRLRQEEEPICSSEAGYWYSKNPEDIEKTLRRLEGQVRNMNCSIEGLKQVLKEITQDEDHNSYY